MIELDIESQNYKNFDTLGSPYKKRAMGVQWQTTESSADTVADGIGNDYKIELKKSCGGGVESLDKNGGPIERSAENYERGYKKIDKWEPAQPVFISAQTGNGKNYFIENTLLPYIEELNYKCGSQCRLLILTNRIALWRQIMSRIGGESYREELGTYSYKENSVYVTTYHKFFANYEKYKRLQRKADTQFIYTICDEAHFFTSDASFNPHTAKILEKITNTFSNSIRVYMSATPDECIPYIAAQEEGTAGVYLDREGYLYSYTPMVVYNFKRDYDYLTTKVYSEIDELYEYIIESTLNSKQKWLIFIDNKNECRRVQEKLLELGMERNPDVFGKENAVFAVDANSKGDARYEQLIRDEKLNDIRILISTSVLDNGVNFRDVDNIVVSDMSPVKCIQMAGRARRESPGDQKTLYLKRFSRKEIGNKINDLHRQRSAYTMYDADSGGYKFHNKYFAGEVSDWEDGKRWFGRSAAGDKDAKKYHGNALYTNDIARGMMEKQLAHLEDVLKTEVPIQKEMPQEYVAGQRLLEEQLRYFGRSYDPSMDLAFTHREALIKFLDESVKRGDIQDIDTFRIEFTTLFDAAYGRADKNRDRNYGRTKINNLLNDRCLPYTITGPAQNGPWTVQRLQPSSAVDTETESPATGVKDSVVLSCVKCTAVGESGTSFADMDEDQTDVIYLSRDSITSITQITS